MLCVFQCLDKLGFLNVLGGLASYCLDISLDLGSLTNLSGLCVVVLFIWDVAKLGLREDVIGLVVTATLASTSFNLVCSRLQLLRDDAFLDLFLLRLGQSKRRDSLFRPIFNFNCVM